MTTDPASEPVRPQAADELWPELRASLLFLFGGLLATAGVVGALGLLLPTVLPG